MTVEIRPMSLDDVEGVADVVQAANEEADRRAGRDIENKSEKSRQSFLAGMRRFVEVDPKGAWVAVDDEGVVGMGEAIRRSDFWGLSMLFVHPRGQSKGIGRQLLDKTLTYAEGSKVRMIMASDDPRALRRYSRAGFAIHPGVEVSGKVDRSKSPADLPGRKGTVDDLDLVEKVEAAVGRDRTLDAAALLETAVTTMEVVEHDGGLGYGLQREGHIGMLGATDTQTAALVLWRLLAKTEEKAEAWCLTAAQNWAVEVALEAGLAVKPGGSMFLSGADQLPGPWIPSGWYF